MIDSKPEVNVAQIQNPVKKLLARYAHAKSLRSEERRVGKECRARGSPEQ